MKLISWNVAGFRACLKKGFDDFFKEIDADVFAIQESKVEKDAIDKIIEEVEKNKAEE